MADVKNKSGEHDEPNNALISANYYRQDNIYGGLTSERAVTHADAECISTTKSSSSVAMSTSVHSTNFKQNHSETVLLPSFLDINSIQNASGLSSTNQSTGSPSADGLLSPRSLRFNPFDVPSIPSPQLAASEQRRDDHRFDQLAFGDPTFISSYFSPAPGHDGAPPDVRPRTPLQNDRTPPGSAAASPHLSSSQHQHLHQQQHHHHRLVQFNSAMPPDFAGQQRAPLNTLSGYSAQGQNAPGPVILQDYTHRLAPGQARFPAHPDNVPPSMTHHQSPVNPSGIMPRVEIKGYTSSARGVAASSDHAPSRSVMGFAKNSPAHLRRPSLEEDGVEDEMYSHEDAPLLVSDYLLAPSSKQPGQQGAAKPSRWSRAAAARGEQGEAVASSAAVAYVESLGVKRERSSSAASPVSSVPGDMLRHHEQQQHDNDERNSLRRNARGLSSNGGSIDHGVDFADSKTPPAAATTTLWQRNPYGQFSPTTPGDGEEAGALSVAYRHCHRKRMLSLTDRLALRQLISVVVLCILFMIGEAVGGVLSNSLALFTDVLHLGSDLISFIISLLAMWLSNKPASKKMSFGYHRAEVIGALLSVFIIWLVSGILCYIAIERIIKGHYIDVRADEMLITASLGVVFNFIMGFVLHSEVCCGKAHSHKKFGHGHSHGGHGHSHGGHGHSHGGHGHSHGGHGHSHDVGHNHSHSEYSHKDLLDVPSQDDTILTGGESFDYQQLHQESEFETSGHQMTSVISDTDAIVARDEEELLHKHKNINVRAAFIHVVGDIIQSIGVLVAALIIKFTDDDKFKLADPICTFLFSVLVLVTTITILRDALLVVMEGVPRDLSFDVMKRDLKALDGVVAVHSLHIWALTLDRNALAVHLAIENHEIHNQVLTAATKLLQDRYFFFHTTIQVEIYHPAVMSECHECLELN